MDHGETNECHDGMRIALTSRASSVFGSPREGAFDDPSLRKDDDAMSVIVLDVYVVE